MSKQITTDQGVMPYLPFFLYGRGKPGFADYSDIFDLKNDSAQDTEAVIAECSLYIAYENKANSPETVPVMVHDNNDKLPLKGSLVYIQPEHYASVLSEADENFGKPLHVVDEDEEIHEIFQHRTKVKVTTSDWAQVEAWAYEVMDPSFISIVETQALYISSWEDYHLMLMDAEFEADFEMWKEDDLMRSIEHDDAYDDNAFEESRFALKHLNSSPSYKSVQPSSKAFSSSKSKFYMEEGKEDSQYIWYVAYGSNLNVERFLKYMNISRYTDKTKFCAEDLESVQVQIPHGVYFAKSGRWGDSGIAFLDVDTTENYVSTVRAYRLTVQQFWSLVCQENGSKSMTIDWDGLEYAHHVDCKETGLYSRVANLGWINGERVLTCTNKDSYDSQLSKLKHALPWQYAQMGMLNPPSHEYLNVINEGVDQTAELETVEVEKFTPKKRKKSKTNSSVVKFQKPKAAKAS